MNRTGLLWKKYGYRMNQLVCDHKGKNDDWGYQIGSGIVEQYCSKCGVEVFVTPIDDLPTVSIKRVVKLMRDDD